MLIASIRAPGKYNGVVFFDRWNNCYLFSGVYLMYISDAIKDTLRPYWGKSMEIDAKEVYQPMNPGDGLIKNLAVNGESIENPRTPSILGIDLRANISKVGNRVKATIEIRNRGPNDALVDPSELGFAVIAHEKPLFICPSDGTSCAVITGVDAASPGGKTRVGHQTWAWKPDGNGRSVNPFSLNVGDLRTMSLVLDLPKGSYEFVAGYGGGVHAGPCIASNSVPFDIVN